MHPGQDAEDRTEPVGRVNLAGRPGILLGIILGAGALTVMIAVLVLILTNVFRVA